MRESEAAKFVNLSSLAVFSSALQGSGTSRSESQKCIYSVEDMFQEISKKNLDDDVGFKHMFSRQTVALSQRRMQESHLHHILNVGDTGKVLKERISDEHA